MSDAMPWWSRSWPWWGALVLTVGSGLVARVNGSPSTEAPGEETLGLISRVLEPASIGLWVRG